MIRFWKKFWQKEFPKNSKNQKGPKKGYHTLRTSETDGFKDSEEFKSLYLPHNFIDGMQTMLFDSLGSIMGVYACSRTDKSEVPFSKEETLLFDKISPYIFYAFRKYRWLMHINFFDAPNLNEMLYGVVICDKKGKITWQNDVAGHVLSKYHGSAQKKLPSCLQQTYKNIEALNNNENVFIFAGTSAHFHSRRNITKKWL